MISARRDRGGLEAAFNASLETPCVAEKLKGTTFDEFAERIKGMRVLSFYDGDKPIGAAVFHDQFGHIGIDYAYHGRWASRSVVRAIMDEWGVDRAAMVDERNEKALRFTMRLGLVPVVREGYMVRFQ